MTRDELELLQILKESKDGSAFAVACDGANRKRAHNLEDAGLALWKGTCWGSSFYQITEAGEKALNL